MKFRSAYDHGVRQQRTPSCNIQHEYLEQFDDKGRPYLVESGSYNMADLVQAGFESSLIYNILDRYNAGDESAIPSADKGAYVDLVGMPRDLVEAGELSARIKRTYSELSSDVRAKFSGIDDFRDSLFNGTFASRFKPAQPEKEVNNESEH